MAYVYLNLNPLNKHTGDCVVRAISFALKQPWDETYWQLCRKGYERAEMPSWNSAWWSLLKDKNFRRYVIPDSCPDCYNVADFAYDHPNGIYVLGFGGHVATIIDGILYDSWDSSHEIPIFYWSRED